MRALPAWLHLSYLLLNILSANAAIVLTQFQPISGFSAACTAAYNTPLAGCVITDFYTNRVCSAQCVAFLQGLTNFINQECQGTKAFPNTLIGMFFKGTAVGLLCPNIDISTVSSPGTAAQAKDTTPATTTTSTASLLRPQISNEQSTTTPISTTNVSSTLPTSTGAPSSPASSTIASSSSLAPSPSPALPSQKPSIRPISPSQSSLLGLLPPNSSTSSSRSAQATSGSSSSSDSDNSLEEGGTVLDAAFDSAGYVIGPERRIWPVLAGLGSILWLL